MKIVIRADASVQAGSGHVMRCAALAHELRARGCHVAFVCREHPGNLIGQIEAVMGFPVHRLSRPDQRRQPASSRQHSCPSLLEMPWANDAQETSTALEAEGKADWLVVDHYGIDRRWEKSVRSWTSHILAVDDLADRPHSCDVLLDQNLSLVPNRYQDLVPSGCRLLLGPQHALLREEFRQARAAHQRRTGQVKRLMVFFGGSDDGDQTGKTLDALRPLAGRFESVDVVVGAMNPNADALADKISRLPNGICHRGARMAEVMMKADLAIGAGGSTTWERCCLGLPSVVIAVAENQVPIAQAVAAAGAAVYLGRQNEVELDHVTAAIKQFLDTPALAEKVSHCARELVDGCGTQRVADVIVDGRNKGSS